MIQQPIGSHFCQHAQPMAHRLSPTFEPAHRAVASKHVVRIGSLPLCRTACATRIVSSGMAGIGWGCIDMDSLLVSLTLSFFISISYVSPILLWQFANNGSCAVGAPPRMKRDRMAEGCKQQQR